MTCPFSLKERRAQSAISIKPSTDKATQRDFSANPELDSTRRTGSNKPDNKPERICITSQLKRLPANPERDEKRRNVLPINYAIHHVA
jgi:hypothetical protein